MPYPKQTSGVRYTDCVHWSRVATTSILYRHTTRTLHKHISMTPGERIVLTAFSSVGESTYRCNHKSIEHHMCVAWHSFYSNRNRTTLRGTCAAAKRQIITTTIHHISHRNDVNPTQLPRVLSYTYARGASAWHQRVFGCCNR